jgi:hypothetical protein
MSETSKTFAFVAAAVLSVAGAYFVESNTATFDVQEQVGKVLNEDIDPAAPRRLKIVKFDRTTASTREFEVAEVNGVWSIPSKQNYPADATRQMAEAATCVIDRKILRVAGKSAESHEEFGVVDPLASNLNSQSRGVGTRVVMSDAEDSPLVDMIIGKKVKDSDTQRYVRNSSQDVTYVVEIDPSKLSTDFADWIEDDLLKLSAFDVRRVFVNDYSAELKPMIGEGGRLTIGINWQRRSEMTLGYDDEASKWNVVDLKKYDPAAKAMAPDAVAADEELNQEKLNGLRNGLDDLLIVDVERKPQGLSNDLKTGKDFLNNRETIQDLMEKGFTPVPPKPDAEPELLSSEGEVVCTQKDGVEYVLRFGQLQVQTESDGAKSDAEEAEDKPADESQAGGEKSDAEKKQSDEQKTDDKNLRRYLFVMARFNKDVIEQPKLQELPELPSEAPADGEASPAGIDSTPTGDADASGDAGSGANDSAEATVNSPKDDGGKSGADEPPAADASGDEAAKPAEDAPVGDGGDGVVVDGDGNVASGPGESADKSSAKPDAKSTLDEAIAERKLIEAENQRLLEEYATTIKDGQKKVADLNRRFGDWYYVISNDVYKQIHLSRGDAIKKIEKAEDKDAAQADDPAAGLPQIPAAPAK